MKTNHRQTRDFFLNSHLHYFVYMVKILFDLSRQIADVAQSGRATES